MAYPFGKPEGWKQVKSVIDLFVAMGCVVETLPYPVKINGDEYSLRYLYNPATEGFVPLSDLEDGDYVPPETFGNWERRLGVELPKGSLN